MEAVLSSWINNIYEPEDLEINEMLEFFQPFDQVSPEILSGFMITPNETYKSIYLNIAGETDTSSLEIDFDGYVTMLYESRAYKNSFKQTNISEIPDLLINLSKLETLILSYCQIKEIPEFVLRMKALKVLSLVGNPIGESKKMRLKEKAKENGISLAI